MVDRLPVEEGWVYGQKPKEPEVLGIDDFDPFWHWDIGICNAFFQSFSFERIGFAGSSRPRESLRSCRGSPFCVWFQLSFNLPVTVFNLGFFTVLCNVKHTFTSTKRTLAQTDSSVVICKKTLAYASWSNDVKAQFPNLPYRWYF